MARITEPLSGGLRDAIDNRLLNPGDLIQIQNAFYKRGDVGLRRAPGRSIFGTVSATAVDVVGLRDVQFDNGDNYLIAHASASYLTATVGDTGTFGVFATGVGIGSQLERIHYRNRFFLLNGAQGTATGIPSNRVFYLSATAAGTTPTIRQHGMLPVASPPFTTASATSFSQTVTGYYEYWTTEIAKLTQDGTEFVMESGFSGNPATVFVSQLTTAPVITLPGPLANPDVTTHWRIYRSPKKDKEADKKFPAGFMIAELGTATANHVDTLAVATATSFPASFNSGGQFYVDFASASSMSADDNVYARATAGQLVSRSQGMYNFNLGGFSGQVRGIEVEFQASAVASAVLVGVRIGKNRNSADGSFLPDLSGMPAQFRQIIGNNILGANTSVKSVLVTATSNPGQTVTLGSSSDRWFPANQTGFTDTDFSGNFMIVISAMRQAGSMDFAVDYVKLKVYYGGSIDSVVPFPTVAYTFGDITAQVMKNGPPPFASTGDMFEDTFVVNDVYNPSVVRYSYPGDPEAFPPTYYLDFETADNDRVTNIKAVNNRLIVFLEGSAHRLNYLPSERDASFDRGKATEVLSSRYGCVNEMCACTFTPPTGGQLLAFVSTDGIHVTDGFSFDTWTDKILWRNRSGNTAVAIVGAASATSTPISLVDDPENQRLIFLYRNDSAASNETYKALYLHYSEVHLNNGRPTIAGKTNMRNFDSGSSGRADPKSCWTVRRSTGYVDTYWGYGGGSTAAGAGTVYRENSTITALPAQDPLVGFRSRIIVPGGYGNEVKINDLYPHMASTVATTATFNLQTAKTNASSFGITTSSKTVNHTANASPLKKLAMPAVCESFIVSASATANTVDGSFLNFSVEYDDLGEEDSGRT